MAEFEHTPRWVAWVDRDGRKIPYNPATGHKASTSEPDTWADHATAQVRAKSLINGHGAGGVGIVLGPVDDDWSLGGVDLDSCLDERGRMAPWAEEIVDRLGGYAEVSPSGRGVKLFFLYRTDDLPELRRALNGSLGRQWKTGPHAGVELYLSGRYFAVTGKPLDDAPDGMVRLRRSELEWTIEAAKAAQKGEAEAPVPDDRTRDDSGSGYGWRFMMDRAAEDMSEGEAIDAILDDDGPAGAWARRASDRDLERAFRRAVKRVEDRSADRVGRLEDCGSPVEGLPLLSPDDCGVADLPPYVVKGLISKGNIVCIVGAPGSGKSLLAPYLGYCVAQGEDAFGLRVRRGPVVYVAAEDPSGMEGRVRALLREYGAAPDFHLSTTVRDLLRRDSPDLASLKITIKALRPSLVVIDTLSRAFPGLEENDAAAMGRVVAIAEDLVRLGPAIVLVHHDTKDGQQRLPRGHSVLNGALDGSIVVEKGEGGVVSCLVKKVRNGPDGWSFGFAIKARAIGIDDDGDAVRAAYADELKRSALTPRKGRPPKAAAAALSILVAMHEGRGSVPEDEWREACVEGRKVSGSENAESRRAAFRRAAQDLVRLERVTFADGAYSLEGIEQ